MPSKADAIERATLRAIWVRLVPFLLALYVFNFLDRMNVAMASLTMNRDLHFSDAAFGFGAGIFFVSYALLEVPSNMLLVRFGARRWIARIMISWGLLATATMLVRTPFQFYAVRFLLGAAEAGFFPGIVFYLSLWFPADRRASATALFMIGGALSGAIGSPVGGLLLGLDGRLGLAGWQWLYLLEGLPSVLLGVAVLFVLPDGPATARWLDAGQRAWLAARVARPQAHATPGLGALAEPKVWLLAVPYFMQLMLAYSYSVWAPTFVRDTVGSSNLGTGVIVGGIAAFSAVCAVIVARHSDERRERCLHVGVCLGVAACGYLGAALLPTPMTRLLALALVQTGAASALAPFWCVPTTLLTGEAAAVGVALINSLANIAGLVGPWLVGVLRTASGGNRAPLLMLAAVGVMVSVGWAVLARVLRVGLVVRADQGDA
jgi:MFS transporter, ACS family, tartrate transporter